ncbi:MAG: hypothetical protein LBV08_09150 [Clostridiales bacterium]|jgi:hypothetical protein|nr:hypothetical protein [Clostridiales bacterium]
MNASQLKIYYEDLDISDEELIDMIEEVGQECLARKESYNKARDEFDEYNYCAFLMAKLYYEFCKEEYHKLYTEAHKRRLISE